MLKKTAKTLLLISGIIGIISAVVVLALGIVFTILGSTPAFHEVLVEGLIDGSINSDFQGTPAEVASQIQIMFVIIGIIFIVFGTLNAGSAAISFVTFKKMTLTWLIINLVIACVSQNYLSIAGSICGFIKDNSQE